jgi:hypothetical protein
MTTLAVAFAEIAALRARIEALEGGSGGHPSSSGGGSSGGGEALSDSQLNNAWADKKITKDPPKWKGPTQVNRTYSKAPIEWLESMAGFLDWKAQKGREEVPVRMNNKNRPWHESDTFEAKILRGWARRKASKPAPAKAAPQADDDFGFGPSAATGTDDDSEIPF